MNVAVTLYRSRKALQVRGLQMLEALGLASGALSRRRVASSHVFTNSQMHTFSGWKERSAAFKIVCTLRLRPGKPYANLISTLTPARLHCPQF